MMHQSHDTKEDLFMLKNLWLNETHVRRNIGERLAKKRRERLLAGSLSSYQNTPRSFDPLQINDAKYALQTFLGQQIAIKTATNQALEKGDFERLRIKAELKSALRVAVKAEDRAASLLQELSTCKANMIASNESAFKLNHEKIQELQRRNYQLEQQNKILKQERDYLRKKLKLSHGNLHIKDSCIQTDSIKVDQSQYNDVENKYDTTNVIGVLNSNKMTDTFETKCVEPNSKSNDKFTSKKQRILEHYEKFLT